MNTQKIYFAIGIMSGSSLDGLDIVYCKFTKENNWSFEILAEQVYDLSNWEDQLKNSRNLSEKELDILDTEFGSFIGEKISEFIQEKNIKEIDIISSHGHTVYHFPEKGITKQIGSGLEIFQQTQIPTLYNLRQKDIDKGGSGAPIVPIGDLHLFSKYKYCLNIGGIANISIKTESGIIAFDICSANQVLNYFASKLNKKYDNKGSIAKSGKLNTKLFEALNELSFYNVSGPKSLDNAFTNEVLKITSSFDISIKDELNTYCHHIAFQIANSINVFIGGKYQQKNGSNIENNQLLITGGGAFNHFLIEQIRNYNKQLEIIIPKREIIDNKEALVMAFMGVLYLRKEVNCLASVTGASSDTICGEFITKKKISALMA